MRAVPAAKNRNDALSTFLYVAFNRTPVVSEKVEALAATCQIDSEVSNLQAQIDMLSKTLSRATSSIKAMDSALSQIMTMLVWLVGERANASIDLSQPAAAIDFMFAEQEFIRQRAESQTDEYIKYQAEMQARARYKASAAARDGRRWHKKSVMNGEIQTIVVFHKDRFVRFGFDWFENLCKRFNTEIIVVNNESFSPNE